MHYLKSASAPLTTCQQLGSFLSFQHGVKGDLEQLARDRMVVHNFTYDGRGPGGSTFFYAVNSSAVYSPADVARGYKGSQGFKRILPFPYQVILS